jgi:hypothetical protein
MQEPRRRSTSSYCSPSPTAAQLDAATASIWADFSGRQNPPLSSNERSFEQLPKSRFKHKLYLHAGE